jgi:hypothetical protein
MVYRSKRARALRIGLALTTTVAAAPGLAEPRPPSAMETSAARTLGRDGIKAAEAGDCRGAAEKLERAEQLFHAPTILGRLGECQVALGRLLVGLENLERVVREDLGPRAPPAFQVARERARKVLEKNRHRLPRLKVVVEGPASGAVVVTVDGVALPAALIGTEAPADPGEHLVSVSAPGYVTGTTKVTLAEGASAEAKVTLARAPVEKPAPSGAVAAKPQVDARPAVLEGTPLAQPEPPRRSRALAYVGLGAGAAGLALGGTFGLMAMGKQSALDKVCPNKECPASAQADLETMRRDGDIATGGFVAGGALLAAGAVLWFVLAPSEPAAPTLQAWPLELRPALVPGFAGVSGEF